MRKLPYLLVCDEDDLYTNFFENVEKIGIEDKLIKRYGDKVKIETIGYTGGNTVYLVFMGKLPEKIDLWKMVVKKFSIAKASNIIKEDMQPKSQNLFKCRMCNKYVTHVKQKNSIFANTYQCTKCGCGVFKYGIGWLGEKFI